MRRVHGPSWRQPKYLTWVFVVCVCFSFMLGKSWSNLNSASRSRGRGPTKDAFRIVNIASENTGHADLLPIPESVKYVYINIGTNFDPWPGCGTKKLPYDPEIFCIYVDPLFRVHDQLRAQGIYGNNSTISLLAAISATPGLLPLYEYGGVSGVASSLSKVTEEQIAANPTGPYSAGFVGVSAVVVVSLKTLIDAIPTHLRIVQVKTDMQGHDFAALRSAGESLRRVERIYNECLGEDEADIYQGIDNRYLTHMDYMHGMGFATATWRKVPKHDCMWTRSRADAGGGADAGGDNGLKYSKGGLLLPPPGMPCLGFIGEVESAEMCNDLKNIGYE